MNVCSSSFSTFRHRWNWNGRRVKQKDKRKIRKNSINLKRKELSRTCLNWNYHLSYYPKSIQRPSSVSNHFAIMFICQWKLECFVGNSNITESLFLQLIWNQAGRSSNCTTNHKRSKQASFCIWTEYGITFYLLCLFYDFAD